MDPDPRSPMRIAVDSLSSAREAARAGDLVTALDHLDVGLAALGVHYQRAALLDDSALRLALAAARRGQGDLAGAFAGAEAVLEERVATYEGRSGETC